MKHIYTCMFVLLLFAACTKRTELLFNGSVDQRLQAALAYDSATLVNSAYGWKGILYPGNGEGAYFFHLQFKTNGTVTMIGDVDTAAAARTYTSTFRLKAIQLPALIFDTYTYIHKLSDPDPNVSGGTAGKGQYTDFEFSFLSVKEDSVFLKGNVNGSSFVLTKASQAERDAYTSGALRELMNAANAYTTANPYLFLQFPDGAKVPFGLSVRNKMIVLQYVDDNNTVVSLNTNFYFTRDSLSLRNPIVYKGNAFETVYWDNTAKLFYIKLNNQRTEVGSVTSAFKLPLLPELRKEVFKTYASILINPTDTFGLPPLFMTILKDALTKMAAGGRNVTKIELLFPAEGQAQLKFSYLSGTTNTFSACTYDMSIDSNGLVSFVVKTAISVTAVRTAVKQFTDYLETNKFTFSYIANTANSKLLGGLFHQTNPVSFFFGELK